MIRIKPVDSTSPILEALVYLTKKIIKEDSGLYYEVEYKGQTKYLNRNGMDFILYGFMGEEVECEIFSLDENYCLESIILDHHTAIIDGNNFWFVDKKNNSSSLRILERPDGCDINGYNGILSYTQCNTSTNESFTMNYSYQYNKNGTNKIFPLTNRIPFVINFKKGEKSKTYITVKIDLGNPIYDYIAIREYGLKAFMGQGSYVLEKEDTLHRYIRAYGKYADKTYLIGKYYKLEDLLKKAQAKGYNTEIPNEIISFYNDFSMESISDYLAIANAFKEIDNTIKPTSLEKKD